MKKRWIAIGLAAALLMPSIPVSAGEAVTEAETESAVETAVEAAAEDETETDAAEGEPEELYRLRYAKDYREVYEAVKNASYYYKYDYEPLVDYELDGAVMEESAEMATGTAVASVSDTIASNEKDFYDTNVREQGVDEADIIKTDGTFIYILRNCEKLLIARADGKDTAIVSVTELFPGGENSARYSADMYVDGDQLFIACEENVRVEGLSSDGRESIYQWKNVTRLYTLDVSDREHPEQTAEFSQDGSYSQSRKVGDTIYLYSRWYPDVYETYENSNLVPKVDGTDLPAETICIPDCVTDAAYLIVSSVKAGNPSEAYDTKALISGAGLVYATQQSLYLVNSDYDSVPLRSEIVKFALEEGSIQGIGACKVRGEVHNSFSIDEYNDHLRVLTTYRGSETAGIMEFLGDLFGFDYYDDQEWVRRNAVYIFDKDMHRVSKLGGIARNEEIRSARYFGDTVYFVTFRNTDPLFTADLSDPEHPVITGELKISGFSSYLHPYGEGRLLGMGYEADESTGRTTGLKLSMFDVSDPTDVKEIGRYVIPGITWCAALDNYKAILAQGNKNLIGFCYSGRYMVFSFDEETGFKKVLHYDLLEDMIASEYYDDTFRGLYIDDELYVAGPGSVTAFDMKNGFVKDCVVTAE
ncbi:MAG: beta-propeller domain-containing protein [Lachnospiraceae bacterium]|nr:beta-propeller domain-containing protein [Lachnospiraceae bacterium]